MSGDPIACVCRCHRYGPGAGVACNVGEPQPGGNLSCVYGHGKEPVPIEEACVLGHPEPTERFVGFACRRHYHWIDRTLAQIEELFALLDDVVTHVSGPHFGDSRYGTREGSPAPGRIDIMAITDPRIAGRSFPMSYDCNSDGKGGLEPNGDDVPDVPGSLVQWCRAVIEEQNDDDWKRRDKRLATLDGTVTGSIRTLRAERMWIAQQAWLDLFCEEIEELHRAVAQGAGETMWPRSIGKCPNCQAPLYVTVGIDEVSCRKCKSAWSGEHLARLRLIHEQEAS